MAQGATPFTPVGKQRPWTWDQTQLSVQGPRRDGPDPQNIRNLTAFSESAFQALFLRGFLSTPSLTGGAHACGHSELGHFCEEVTSSSVRRKETGKVRRLTLSCCSLLLEVSTGTGEGRVWS